jgi:transcriptional regulator of acetoin/glycerol metabolism
MSINPTVEERIAQALPRMDLKVIGYAGDRRRKALDAADRELDVIADELLASGERGNLALAAKVAGVSRSTLYRRIQAREASA